MGNKTRRERTGNSDGRVQIPARGKEAEGEARTFGRENGGGGGRVTEVGVGFFSPFFGYSVREVKGVCPSRNGEEAVRAREVIL